MRITRRIAIATLAVLAAVLTIGVVGAAARGGGPSGPAGGPAGLSKLVTQAATQLSVTRSTLTTAIHNSADTHVANMKADGDITASEADDLTASADDNLDLAYRLSETKTVASNLSITTDALNAGFAAARKALALAQVDAALAAGKITSDEATTLKAKINAKTFPGYKGNMGRGLGIGAPGLGNGPRGGGDGPGNGPRHGGRH